MEPFRVRRVVAVLILLIMAGIPVSQSTATWPTLGEIIESVKREPTNVPGNLSSLEVKGRAPKTGYERAAFGNGWSRMNGCDMRNQILVRDLTEEVISEDCKVRTGILTDPYTGKNIRFIRGETTSDDVQIDHVVALSNSWQTGAQLLSYDTRIALANDPLNLLAVDGPTNEKKSDGDAATWLPPNKSYRCNYVNRQISVKSKYNLWVTPAERDAMARVLNSCQL